MKIWIRFVVVCLFSYPISAHAQVELTCQLADTLISNNPQGIDELFIIARVQNDWKFLDKKAVANGHASIAEEMISNVLYLQMVGAECESNPNELLDAVAAEVYMQACSTLHGYLPADGGVAHANPNPKPDSGLSGADKGAIGAHVRPCWNIDAGVPGVSTFSVNLMVTTDSTGTVRQAVVAPQDQGKMSDPIFAAYAQDAISAVLNVQCATLPLPASMLGQSQTFLFNFTP